MSATASTQRVSAEAAPPPLWTVDDVAAYLGVPTGTLYQWSSRGIGPRTRKVGRHLRYRPQDVETWLDERGQDGRP